MIPSKSLGIYHGEKKKEIGIAILSYVILALIMLVVLDM